MTQPHKPTATPDPVLDGPPCPHCHVHTMLSVIAPQESGEDRCTYRCALCGHEQNVAGKLEGENLLIRLR